MTPDIQTSHRDDIQGVRALAVILVLIYHFNPSWLPGGFIGVDVFFAISGFLITRKLAKECVQTGRLDLVRFWSARAKRLFPNALLTLGFTVALAYALLPPYRFSSIAGDVQSASAFFSNFHFAQKAVDYFASNETASPVLHFWSLSVEEQFYFIFPLWIAFICYFISSERLRIFKVFLIFVCAISLTYYLLRLKNNAPFAFFHTETRIWQFALGGLAGLYEIQIQPLIRKIRTPVALLSFAAILYAGFLSPENVPVLGLQSILPTVATASLLLAMPTTIVGKTFSTRPALYIGNLSYSLYLWHWPPLAICAELWPGNLTARIAAAAASLALAYFAYVYVERPFHRGVKIKNATLPLYTAGAAIAAIFVATPLALVAPKASAVRTAAIAAADRDFGANYADKCHLSVEDTTQPPCEYGNRSGSRKVYLFGDSHAAQWFNPVVKAAAERGWKVIVRTRSSCPATDVSIWLPTFKKYYEACDAWRNATIDEINATKPEVVIVSDFAGYDGYIYDKDKRRVLANLSSLDAWQRGTVSLQKRVHADKIIFLKDTPAQQKTYKDCISVSDECSRPRETALTKIIFSISESKSNVMELDLTDDICDRLACPAIKDEKIIYQDDHHLTASFTSTLWKRFLPLFD